MEKRIAPDKGERRLDAFTFKREEAPTL